MNNLFLVVDSQYANAAQTDDFTIRFANPIDLGDSRWELALAKLNLWYSWYNISTELGNNTFRYFNGLVYRNVLIPNGQYSVTQLNQFLHSTMRDYGDFTLLGSTYMYNLDILANYATNRVAFIINGGYTIDLSNGGTLYQLLGGLSAEYSVSGDLENTANLTNNVDNIWARCSLVQGGGSFINDIADDIIYTFVPENIPNTNINIVPLQLIYMPVTTTNRLIREIRVRITDNLGRRLNLNGEPVSFSLQLRRIA